MKNYRFLAPFSITGYVGTTADPSIPEWELALADRSLWLSQKVSQDPSFTIQELYDLGQGWMLNSIENQWQILNLNPGGKVVPIDQWARVILITKDDLSVVAVNSSPERLTGGVEMTYVARNQRSIQDFISSFNLQGSLEVKTQVHYWE